MKTVLFVALVLLVASSLGSQQQSLSSESRVEREWLAFKQRFGREYATVGEERYRQQVFFNNLRIIDDLNRREGSDVFGVTKFADLSVEEFRSNWLMPKGSVKGDVNTAVTPVFGAALPSSFDWSAKGAVTPVYNQGQCGSCWAFSTTEEIESMWFLAGNSLPTLSMQQIVDCDQTDDGCGGGDTPTAYQYVMNAGGLEAYSDYPYTGTNGRCTFNSADVVAKISGWKYITKAPQNNETAMQVAIATEGPLSICVDAESWQFYHRGIIKRSCGHSLDHCVQITGYNTAGATPYWIVRNSWGADWGLQGYLHVEIGKNLCGIAEEVTMAVI